MTLSSPASHRTLQSCAHRECERLRPRGRMLRILGGILLAWSAACGASPAGGGGGGGGGTAGSGGASGAPSAVDGGTATDAAPASGSGVVADGKCVALCANASTDIDGDGWGFEAEQSCIVPGSTESKTRTMCVVGAPLPTLVVGAPAGSAGVVVENHCTALCREPMADPDGDGWGWEFEASCVIPESPTAKTSLPCKVGAPPPTGALNGKPGRLLNGLCTPFCTAVTQAGADGFGFEFGGSCLVAGSAAATTMGIDCKVGDNDLGPPVTLNPNPPPGMVQKPAQVTSAGFFVNNGRLYDKFGNDFVMRGVNNPHIWFDASNQWFAYQALDNLAQLKVNTIRVVWQTTGSAENLARVLRRIVELKMIPMVELHDVTGGTTNESLLLMTTYYVREDVKKVLTDYESFLLINIANEWSGTDFRGAYTSAIAQLRTAGIRHTLVIDSNGFGQNGDTILTDGGALLAGDPQHNLLFSLHMYQQYATDAGRALITSTFDRAVTAKLPLIVGEFGWQFNMSPIDSALIMSECQRLKLGYIAWSWKGNDPNLAYLDMAVDWEGQMLTTWGRDVLQGPNGIALTAVKASIFGP